MARQAGFEDRADAGRRLGQALLGERSDRTVVVGLARGGVVVAAEVARTLNVPLDALAVRKVGHPLQPEYAIGAVTPRGGVYVRAHDGLTEEQVEKAVEAAAARADALDRRLHTTIAPLPIAGMECLLVDDGLATGATMMAAVLWARAAGARRVVVAVPVAATESVRSLEAEADAVVALETPPDFLAVGFWYRDFLPVSEEEVVALLEQGHGTGTRSEGTRTVIVETGERELPGDLSVPLDASGVVLFAHGSGSSRHSPRNRQVAQTLNRAGLATLLFDLLEDEEAADRANVFDIPLLAERLEAAHRLVQRDAEVAPLPVGYFGASTGAAAALWAAADLRDAVSAVVSRGGRPDLARPRLPAVRAPTLLIVGGRDEVVLELNEQAAAELTCAHELVVIPGASHLFEEPGTLEAVAAHTASWFREHLNGAARLG
jgi:putative phosphoribosyl transferase